MELEDNDSLQITKPKRNRAQTIIDEPAAPLPTPILQPENIKRKTKQKKELDSDYLDNLKKAREIRLIKKAEERLLKEEALIDSKTDELRKAKEEKELKEPEIVKALEVSETSISSAKPPKAPRKPRAPRAPAPEPVVVEKIVEKIIYQAPKLNFCFV